MCTAVVSTSNVALAFLLIGPTEVPSLSSLFFVITAISYWSCLCAMNKMQIIIIKRRIVVYYYSWMLRNNNIDTVFIIHNIIFSSLWWCLLTYSVSLEYHTKIIIIFWCALTPDPKTPSPLNLLPYFILPFNHGHCRGHRSRHFTITFHFLRSQDQIASNRTTFLAYTKSSDDALL